MSKTFLRSLLSFIIIGMGIFASVALLAGCDDIQASPQHSARQSEAAKAQAAANSVTFTENEEINNIKRYLEMVSKPGRIGYIVLLNDAGQPIMYEGVKGKITSNQKRLTPPYAIHRYGNGNGGTNAVVTPAPSDMGAWGSSDASVFYWNTSGAFRQWNGRFLYSDQPIQLSVKPLVVTVESKTEIK